MMGNRQVMCFPRDDCKKTLMAASLMNNMVSITGKKAGEIIAVNMSG
jgi:hypothetical protein